MKSFRRILKTDEIIIIGLVLVWWVALKSFAYISLGKFPINSNFYTTNGMFDFSKAWANWDGGHYIGIALNGHVENHQYAFFPLYPILINIVGTITGNFFQAAFFVTNFALILALIFLFKLIKENFKDIDPWKVIIYLLIFPTAVFLAAAYTESLFLLLSVGSFYFALKNKWLFAAVFCAFATATKVVGVFLVIALIIEYLDQKQFSVKKIGKEFLYLFSIAPAGVLFYMMYLNQKFSDPLYFAHVQTYWHKSTTLVNPFEVLQRYYFDLVATRVINLPMFSHNIFDFSFTVLFLVLSAVAFLTLRKSWGIYCFLLTLLPVLSGTLVSQSRYVLIAFPIFILLAKYSKYKVFDFGYTVTAILFLAYFTILFITGQWSA